MPVGQAAALLDCAVGRTAELDPQQPRRADEEVDCMPALTELRAVHRTPADAPANSPPRPDAGGVKREEGAG